MLREEHGAGIQTSLVQLLLHQIPERSEKICEKELVFTELKEESAMGYEKTLPVLGTSTERV